MNNRAEFIRLLACTATIALISGCTRGVEDPAKTQRFTTFLQGILAGKLAERDLTEAMKTALTPEHIAEIRQQYRANGALKGLRFLGQDQLEGFDRYHYVATFDQGTQGMIFVLDSGGRLAGFFNE